MKKQESQAWPIVGVLFVSWFLVWGGGPNTGAVFFPPVLKYFGWSRAKLSAGFAIAAISAGASGPLIGWLLDRIDVRKVMVSGVALTCLGYAGLSLDPYLQSIFGMQFCRRHRTLRLHRNPHLAGSSQLVPRAAWIGDGPRALRSVGRRRGDDCTRRTALSRRRDGASATW